MNDFILKNINIMILNDSQEFFDFLKIFLHEIIKNPNLTCFNNADEALISFKQNQ